ncbi:MAG: porphobilinogen synthase [Puniceicoccaceae bacterium]
MNDSTHRLFPEPEIRMRRLRNEPLVRAMLRETTYSLSNLVLPIFVHGGTEHEPVPSMPGVERVPLNGLAKLVTEVYQLGLPAVALFPVVEPAKKGPGAEEAVNRDSLICQAIGLVRATVPELIVIADLALDPYTDHGHDGILSEDGGRVLNDATVEVLCSMAVVQAEAGAQWVAPSDMMDGRVRAIRERLNRSGFLDTVILAYSAKFNSGYYGPFREAVGSGRMGGPYLDKGGYQLDPGNRREALREAMLDAVEGADLLMVKPAGPYLDVIRDLRERTELPIAAYQVSGEYAQIVAAAERGWLDRKRVRDEALLGIRRAGADLILTYFALEIAREWAGTY